MAGRMESTASQRAQTPAALALAVLLSGLLAGTPPVRADAGGPGDRNTVGGVGGAAAEDPVRSRARALGGEARELYLQGRYLEAAALLDRVHELVPAPQVLYNLARCMHKAGRLDDALVLYRRYLDGEPGAADREEIASLLAELSRRLIAETVPIELAVAPSGAAASIDGSRSWACPAAPCTLRLAPGTYELALSQPGWRTLRRPLVVEAGRAPRLELTLEAEPPLAARLLVKGDLPGAAVRLDGEELGLTPGPAGGWTIRPGTHRVEVAREGYVPWQASVVSTGGEQLVIEPLLQPALVSVDDPGDAAKAALAAPAAPGPAAGRRRSVWPWVAFGTAAACGAAGAGMGLQAYSISGNTLTSEEIQTLQRNAALANVLFGMAGVSLAAGAMLYLMDATQGGSGGDVALRSRGGQVGMFIAAGWSGSSGSVELLLRY